MGHWLDALAKASTGRRDDHRTSSISGAAQTPGSGRPFDEASASHARGLTRRALFKRGAVVGAALWTTPVLQTALAPAASASVDPCVGICGDDVSDVWAGSWALLDECAVLDRALLQRHLRDPVRRHHALHGQRAVP